MIGYPRTATGRFGTVWKKTQELSRKWDALIVPRSDIARLGYYGITRKDALICKMRVRLLCLHALSDSPTKLQTLLRGFEDIGENLDVFIKRKERFERVVMETRRT